MTFSVSAAYGSQASAGVQTMTGASAAWPARQKMSSLYQKIDTQGSGSITSSQFQDAFSSMNPPAGFKSMGASKVLSELDPQGTGSVSRADFINIMSGLSASLSGANGTAAASAAPSASSGSIGATVDTTA